MIDEGRKVIRKSDAPYPSDTKYALSSSFPGSRTTPAGFSPIFFSTAWDAMFPGVVMATMRPRRRWRRAWSRPARAASEA